MGNSGELPELGRKKMGTAWERYRGGEKNGSIVKKNQKRREGKKPWAKSVD